MEWIIFVCIVITCISICDAVTNVNDIIGSTISLECSHSENDKITWKGPYLGNAVYVTQFGINKKLPEELHSRLFVSTDQTNRKTFLRIVNVQITDEGLYECTAGESRLIESFNLQLPGMLSSNDLTYNRFLLIDPVVNKLIVGHMNGISLIDIQDKPVFPAQSTTIHFNPESNKLSFCVLQKPEVPYCQNHIRFITKKTDDTFILCGTNANSPTGYEFNITDNSQVNKGDVPCSNDPSDNLTAIYTTSNNPNGQSLMYYGATKNGESTISRPIYGSDGNVQDYMKGVISNKWMKEPQFVGSFDIDDRVLFFFREVAIEAEPFERKIYSRVAKVCKEDIGGNSMLRNKWTGYQKARLSCSIPGDTPITYDVLHDVVSIDNTMFYGVFTSGVGTPASAICAFNISEIERVFDGQFKSPQVDSLYYWTVENTVPTPRPGVCTNDSLSTSNTLLTFIVDHPLMHESVQPMYDKPVFVMDDVELQQLELHENTSDVIFYAASNTGKVYKLLLKTNITYLSRTFTPFNDSEVIWSMKQHGDYLYIGTDSTVKQINVINCEQHRWVDSCVKDPHCAWINDVSLLSDSSVDDEIQCYNRCRPLSFVEENGLTNNPGVYSHNNYDLSTTTAYSCCPSKPTHLQVTASHKTKLELQWMAGFNGGFDQIFIIEYKKEESSSWESKEFDHSGLDSDPHTFELQGLTPTSTYNIRLHAKNKIGQSTKTNPVVLATKGEIITDKDDGALQIGLGIILGISILLNIILVGIMIIVKYMWNNKQKRQVKGEDLFKKTSHNHSVEAAVNGKVSISDIQPGMNPNGSPPAVATPKDVTTYENEHDNVEKKKKDVTTYENKHDNVEKNKKERKRRRKKKDKKKDNNSNVEINVKEKGNNHVYENDSYDNTEDTSTKM